jgi:phosphatidylserine decarboxylase
MEHPPGHAAPRAPRLNESPLRRARAHPRWRPLTEGGPLILPLLTAGLALSPFSRLGSAVAFVGAGSVVFAFRDPERDVPELPSVALAPADGQVIRVGSVWDEYWEQEMTEVAIFLALWDVHVQRVPLAGKIVAQTRYAGGYRPAMTSEAAHGNNRVATYIETAFGPCTVMQISGLVARRIVTWANTGDELQLGERLGMIKFGSQVTVRLPATARILVEKGTPVRAGLTSVAEVG